MLTAEQAKQLSKNRAIVAQTRKFESTAEPLALRYAQTGLPFTAEHAIYLTVYLSPPDSFTLDRLRHLAADLNNQAAVDDYRWVTVVCVSIPLWARWCQTNSIQIDSALFNGQQELGALLEEKQPPFASTGGDLFFHIKAIEIDTAKKVVKKIQDYLGSAFDHQRSTYETGDSIHNGRIYGGRMFTA